MSRRRVAIIGAAALLAGTCAIVALHPQAQDGTGDQGPEGGGVDITLPDPRDIARSRYDAEPDAGEFASRIDGYDWVVEKLGEDNAAEWAGAVLSFLSSRGAETTEIEVLRASGKTPQDKRESSTVLYISCKGSYYRSETGADGTSVSDLVEMVPGVNVDEGIYHALLAEQHD